MKMDILASIFSQPSTLRDNEHTYIATYVRFDMLYISQAYYTVLMESAYVRSS